jgi:hypothetical protein
MPSKTSARISETRQAKLPVVGVVGVVGVGVVGVGVVGVGVVGVGVVGVGVVGVGVVGVGVVGVGVVGVGVVGGVQGGTVTIKLAAAVGFGQPFVCILTVTV